MTSRSRTSSKEPHDGARKDAPSEPLLDPEAAQIERNLALSPSERLDQLVRTVAFVRAGRAALARRND